jgi:hypothetical protein
MPPSFPTRWELSVLRCRRFPQCFLSSWQRIILRGWLSELTDSEGSVQSREIRAKKMPNRRGPEQPKVKLFVINVVITVNMQ